MKIGIIFALEEELISLKKYVTIENEKCIYGLNFYEGIINNVNCLLVKSGVGKINASRATQLLIDNFKVDYILNVGVAGGLSDNLIIGDIVVGEKLYQHDFDYTALGYKLGSIPEVGDFMEASKFLIEKSKAIKLVGIKYGNIATGDLFCTDPIKSQNIHKTFDALCVEMEGAAVAQVCTLCNVPFIVIRSISDVPNNDNAVDFTSFLVESSNKVADFVNEIIKLL